MCHPMASLSAGIYVQYSGTYPHPHPHPHKPGAGQAGTCPQHERTAWSTAWLRPCCGARKRRRPSCRFLVVGPMPTSKVAARRKKGAAWTIARIPPIGRRPAGPGMPWPAPGTPDGVVWRLPPVLGGRSLTVRPPTPEPRGRAPEPRGRAPKHRGQARRGPGPRRPLPHPQ